MLLLLFQPDMALNCFVHFVDWPAGSEVLIKVREQFHVHRGYPHEHRDRVLRLHF